MFIKVFSPGNPVSVRLSSRRSLVGREEGEARYNAFLELIELK
jgi:hypothetical protein